MTNEKIHSRLVWWQEKFVFHLVRITRNILILYQPIPATPNLLCTAHSLTISPCILISCSDGHLCCFRLLTSALFILHGRNICSIYLLRLSKITQGIFDLALPLYGCLWIHDCFQDAIKQVMHAPMSFFETTVRTFCFILSDASCLEC